MGLGPGPLRVENAAIACARLFLDAVCPGLSNGIHRGKVGEEDNEVSIRQEEESEKR